MRRWIGARIRLILDSRAYQGRARFALQGASKLATAVRMERWHALASARVSLPAECDIAPVPTSSGRPPAASRAADPASLAARQRFIEDLLGRW